MPYWLGWTVPAGARRSRNWRPGSGWCCWTTGAAAAATRSRRPSRSLTWCATWCRCSTTRASHRPARWGQPRRDRGGGTRRAASGAAQPAGAGLHHARAPSVSGPALGRVRPPAGTVRTHQSSRTRDPNHVASQHGSERLSPVWASPSIDPTAATFRRHFAPASHLAPGHARRIERTAMPPIRQISLAPASQFGSYRDLELGTAFDRPSKNMVGLPRKTTSSGTGNCPCHPVDADYRK